MNQKQSTAIRHKANELFVEWLQGLLNKEEASKVSIDNYWKFLPKQSHIFANNPRWVARKIKKLLHKNPTLNLNTITLTDIKKEDKQWKQKENLSHL